MLAAALTLAGCGDFPRPFQGNPGATARRLSQPPPARLAVPVPSAALLGDRGAIVLAGDVTSALQDAEVPAFREPPRPGDWRLDITAQLRGAAVVPVFTVQNPKGVPQGSTSGAPVPADLWQSADPAALKQAATSAAPAIATLLTSIEAARAQSDPNSLVNRPPRVYVPDVTGAPGDGDTALTAQFRGKLPLLGDVVQLSADGADFTVQGRVRTAPAPGGALRVEVQWTVTDARGAEAGRVTQINEVPAGTLDGYWGDVAVVVAQQAAGGVHEVVSNHIIGRRPDGPKPPPAAGQPKPPAG